jgi:hypothetical protein
MANDLAELLSKRTKNIFQGDNDNIGLRESLSVPSRSIFPGIGARNPARNAATKRTVRETRYRGMFRSGMFQRYRKFQRTAATEILLPPILLGSAGSFNP